LNYSDLFKDVEQLYVSYLNIKHKCIIKQDISIIKRIIMDQLRKIHYWQLRKKSNFCVALHPSSLQRTTSTPHSSGFARLEFGAFYFAVGSDFLRDCHY